jgi:hypothetical protein
VVKEWKSLRDNYRQELKKVASFQTSGSDSSHLFKPKWIYFEQMSFLKDFISPASMSGNLPSVPDTDVEESPSKNVHESSTSNPEVVPEETAPTTSLSNTTSAGPSVSDNCRRNLKRKREDYSFLTIEREKLAILKTNNEMKMDADYNFLVSFLPVVKNMNDIQKLKFRMKMSRLALEIMNGSQPASPVTWTSCNEQSIQSPFTPTSVSSCEGSNTNEDLITLWNLK